ncbi:MAG: peptidoglycan DD-metalloendopeptidase family protein, partial [Erysipelotrichaceae bacterium]
MTANIVKLEEQIAVKLKYIELRDIEIKKRMFNMQSAASTNMYVDFVMGATDLVDLMRRSDGVKQITSYDQEQIRLLDADKKILLDDKAEVVNQKEMLAEQKIQKEADKQYIEQLKTQNQELLTAYRVQEASLLEKQRGNESARQAIVANMKKVKVPGSMPTSTGWMLPVQDNYFISAGSFYYSDGVSPHLGLDFAASVGTPLYAPIDAVILYANNPCPTYGGLGQWVGYPEGGGNTVHMLGSVRGVTYAVSYFHMQQENFRAGNLEEVTQGEYIGNVGSSGNSSGGHLHMEIINLGDMTIDDAVNRFNSTADFTWRTGWNLGRTCNGNGGVAPCRERPEEVLGF